MTRSLPHDWTGIDGMIVDIVGVAHGGHMVARHEGRVIFVRHALPGERVKIRVTEESRTFLRADAIEVLSASPHRVSPPCPVAGTCGGCDFQHVDEAGQLELLTTVVREQLARIAKIDFDVSVEPIGEMLGWRTRMDWAVDPQGKAGLRRHRSHEVLPNPPCLIAHRDLPSVDAAWNGDRVRAVVTSSGQKFVAASKPIPDVLASECTGVLDHRGTRVTGSDTAVERVHGRRFEVSPIGFWQVHPRAAETLVDAVLDFAQPQPGETAFDLYSGVGLFSAFLADHVGATGAVHAIEGSRHAQQHAMRNVAEFPQAHIHHGSVEKVLHSGRVPKSADLIVADPPRAGAKAAIPLIASRGASRIVHVACDPAALARDITIYRQQGYFLRDLRAFALFPMTHHVECVALFEPTS